MPCTFEHPGHWRDDCQFEVAEDELTEFDGKQWCIFHLPMKSESDVESSKAGFQNDEIEEFNRRVHAIIDLSAGDEESAEGADRIDLTGVVFPGAVSFKSKKFESADFSEATFTGRADFSEATFTGTAYFDAATFTGDANFRGATFTGHADFNEAAFSGDTCFNRATFHRDADFSIAGSSLSFYEPLSSFLDDHLVYEPSHWKVSFDGAKFGAASFENRQFMADAHFGGSHFGDSHFETAPRFYGCAIYPGTEFPGPEGFPDTESDEAPQAYHTLKLAMKANGSRKDQAMFYALEQKSLRSLRRTGQIGWPRFVFSWLYGKISNYGYKVWLSVVGLVVFAILFLQAEDDAFSSALATLESWGYLQLSWTAFWSRIGRMWDLVRYLWNGWSSLRRAHYWTVGLPSYLAFCCVVGVWFAKGSNRNTFHYPYDNSWKRAFRDGCRYGSYIAIFIPVVWYIGLPVAVFLLLNVH